MKLNLWQWLGVALLIVGGVWFVAKRWPSSPQPASPPASAPAAVDSRNR